MLDNSLSFNSKMMLVTNQLDHAPTGGRELLCKLNYDVLKDIYQDRLVLFELHHNGLQGFNALLGSFKGYIDGLDAATIAKTLQTIQLENVTRVFVDGSNLGGFVAVLKRTMPKVEVITFLHNVEARFFLGSLRQKKSLRALAVLMVNYLAEKKAVKFSDKIICLNARDSGLLKRIYGRGATDISPMALADKLPVGFSDEKTSRGEKFALFVGGTFYANKAGIAWFVQHVAPRINIKICIVGKGFETLREELEIPGKVEVIGAVDSLAEWYRRAQFVIAPIFDGSGMKTKVAEALMYGKKIIGTPEAFSGYEENMGRAGWMCQTANEFVEAIGQVQNEIALAFDQNLRTIYEKNYSYMAAKDRLSVILE